MESATSSAAKTAPPLAADTVDRAGELIDARSRLLRLGGTSGPPLSSAAPTGSQRVGRGSVGSSLPWPPGGGGGSERGDLEALLKKRTSFAVLATPLQSADRRCLF